MKRLCYNMVKSGVVSAFCVSTHNSLISKRRMFMMTRNIRKVVSIVCALALLLSLCTVSLINSTSAAITEADKKNDVYDTVAEYNFNDQKGIGYKRYGEGGYQDEAFLVKNSLGGGAYYLAKPDYTGATVDHPNTAQFDNLLLLDANASYRITYKYKYLAESTQMGVTLMSSTNVTSVAPAVASGMTVTKSSTSSMNMPEGVTALTADTEWFTDEICFTVGANALNVGFRAAMGSSNDKYCYALIDDVKVEKIVSSTSTTYADMSKDAELFAQTGDAFNNYGSSKSGGFNSVTANADGSVTYDLKSGNWSTDFWWNINRVVRDRNNNAIFLNKGYNYVVTVEYKVVEAKVNGHIGFAYANGASAGSVECKPLAYTSFSTGYASSDWEEFTAVVDSRNLNKTALRLIFAGAGNKIAINKITVLAADANSAIIKYVDGDKVTYATTTAGNEINLTVPTNEDPDKGFAGWFSGVTNVGLKFTPVAGLNVLTARWANTVSKVTLVNIDGESELKRIAVGLELPIPTKPVAGIYFEGWYTDLNFTTQVTEVPDYDITLYAKYTGTYLDFDNVAVPANTPHDKYPTIVADPADANNKVLKIQVGDNSRNNFMLAIGDYPNATAFELKTSSTYTYSFRYKVGAGSDGGDFSFLRGDSSSYTADSTRSFVGSGISFQENTSEQDGDWITVTGTFTTGPTMYLERVKWSYQNRLMLSYFAGTKKDAEGNTVNKKATIYIDDFVVARALDEAPEGHSTINFETNGSEVAPIYGVPGETITLPAAPVSAGSVFLGWYTDKNLTVPFTATTFTDKNLTLYAKWESTGFLVDFSNYQVGGQAARAKFVKDENGNDYLDWWVKYATTNTGDTGTPYRVFLNKNNEHYTVINGLEYTMTFKYKLLEGTVTVSPVTNGLLNGWADYKIQNKSVTLSKVDADNWQEASVTFTAKTENEKGKYLSIGIANHGHVLIDDITVTCSASTINLYGSSKIFFVSNEGSTVQPISGEPGEAVVLPSNPTRAGYMFNGWFTDDKLEEAYTAKTFGEGDITLYADWIIGKFSENFEDFPAAVAATGLGGGHKVYNSANFKTNFDKANVKGGDASLFRDGTTKGTKAFTLCRTADYALTKGKQYTLTFYIKPSEVTAADGTISLISMANNTTGINSPTSTNLITKVGDLKAGEWQQVSYTFTATDKYIGIQTTTGNSLYFDNVTVTLKGYTGTTTGDSSANPMIIVMMVVLAAGALIVTGKKVYSK